MTILTCVCACVCVCANVCVLLLTPICFQTLHLHFLQHSILRPQLCLRGASEMQSHVQALEKAVNADMKQVSEYFGELHEAGDPSKMLRVIGNFLRVFDSTLDEIKVNGSNLTGFIAVNQCLP